MRRVNSQEIGERSLFDKAHSSRSEEAQHENIMSGCQVKANSNRATTAFSWSWFSLPGVRELSSQASRKNAMTTTVLPQPQDELEMCPILSESLSYGFSTQISSSSSSSSSDSTDDYFEPVDLEVQQTPTTKALAEKPKRPLGRLRETLRSKSKPLDVEEYAAGREMTKTQEHWNALSMVPPTIYCLVYLFTSAWINSDLLEKAQEDYDADPLNFLPQIAEASKNNGSPWTQVMGVGNDFSPSSVGCLPWNILPALPPLTILSVIVGTTAHMPFSFLYHWNYAHKLDRVARMNHWSRRLDQMMIHFASAAFSYATSGSFDFFVACALFNLHCMYRHAFLAHYRPRSNQLRIGIAILAYSLPILRRGDLDKFGLFWLIMGTSIWLFSKYPIGGWSHCAFHFLIGLVPVILMQVAKELPVSQPQIIFAAQCSVMSRHAS